MTLKEYLFHNKMSVKEFADILDYSRTHISAIVNDKSYASPKLIRRIERLTEGKVTKEDLPTKPPELDNLDSDVLGIIQEGINDE